MGKRCGVVLGLALFFLFVPFALAQQKGASVERSLFDAVNHERRQQGLPALEWNEALAGAARKHAELMARQGSLSHQFPGEPSLAARVKQVGVSFSWLAENIAQGASASDIHGQFMKSPNHRANILDSEMNIAGIGVAQADGKWFAVEDFSKAK